ncbi:MAG TPA: hypothetical protein VFV99_21610, partial [Kofleriaceae bacterium]|nr:hypothetical protein [Kofleriaceae bacterium]
MRKVHGWRRVARWVIGIVGGFVGLVALVVIVAFIVFSTGWGRGILKNQIATRLDKAFVGGASIGRVDGNPLSELVLHDIVINGPDKQPAITVKQLTVRLPLLPLISHQLRVEKVIAEDLEVRAKRLRNGDYNVDNLMNKSEPSTWSVYLPNLEVRRGHVLVEQGQGAEPIDIDNIEVNVDAALPFAGPMSANARVTGQWRQKRAPISIGAVIHGDAETFEVRNAGVQVGDVRAIALGVKLPKGTFAKPYAGTVAVSAPAKAVRELVPSVRLPEDIALAVTVRPGGRRTDFEIAGAIGEGQVSAFGSADMQAKLASVVVAATDLNLTKLTNGNVVGHGGAFAALELDGAAAGEVPTVTGMVHAWPVLDDTPPLEIIAGIDSAGDRIRATVGAVSDSGIRAGIDADVLKRGETITLERADLIASTLDVGRATAGKAPLRGVLTANLHAEGELAPRMDLALAGHANGRRIRMAGASAQRLAMRIDAKHLPSHPAGSGRVELLDVRRGDLQFSNLTVAAGNRPDGKLQVSVRSHPKPAPWRVDLDALVTTGDTIVVDLQRHFVRAAGGSTWTGNTGRVTIGPRKIEVRNFKSSGGNGTVTADASYVRAGRDQGDLAARVDASFDLGNLMQAHKGHVEAHVDAKRADGRFTGTVVATAKGVTLDPKSPVAFDGDVKIEARGVQRQVLAHASVSTAKAGSLAFALDVDAPTDITNARAWKRLDRNAIRTAKLTVKQLDLAMISKVAGSRAPALSGNVNGSLELSPARAGGTIAIRGVQTQQTKDLGSITADLKVAQDGAGELKTTLTARLEPNPNAVAAKDITKNGQAHLLLDATFRTPDRIFDPAAWKRLGPNAFGGATLRAERLAFEPGTLERLGIVSSMRGELAVGADVDPGMKSVRFAINLYQLRGGLFAQPIAVSVVGAVDEQSTRANADIRGQGVTLLHASTEIPVTLDQLRRDAQSAKSAPLSGQVRIDHVPAKALMNVIGTSQITGGTLDGTIDLAGTVADPTVDAKLVAQNVTVPNEGTREVQQIKQLTIAAKWDGTAGNVAIDSDQTGGGKLTVRAAGAPSDLDKVSATIKATKLDIAPLVAFMPGPAGGLAGRLDADFALRGANPRTADLAGSLHVTDGRIPIAPTVGTLFRGDVKLDVKNKQVGLNLTGKLGRGDVALTANAPLDGISPTNGELKLTVRNV